MSKTTTGFTALALVLSLGLITAPAVFSKAHDSGVSENESPPGMGGRASGTPPGASTSEAAQGLGGRDMGPDTSAAAQAGRGFSEGKGDISGGAGGNASGSSNPGR